MSEPFYIQLQEKELKEILYSTRVEQQKQNSINTESLTVNQLRENISYPMKIFIEEQNSFHKEVSVACIIECINKIAFIFINTAIQKWDYVWIQYNNQYISISEAYINRNGNISIILINGTLPKFQDLVKPGFLKNALVKPTRISSKATQNFGSTGLTNEIGFSIDNLDWLDKVLEPYKNEEISLNDPSLVIDDCKTSSDENMPSITLPTIKSLTILKEDPEEIIMENEQYGIKMELKRIKCKKKLFIAHKTNEASVNVQIIQTFLNLVHMENELADIEDIYQFMNKEFQIGMKKSRVWKLICRNKLTGNVQILYGLKSIKKIKETKEHVLYLYEINEHYSNEISFKLYRAAPFVTPSWFFRKYSIPENIIHKYFQYPMQNVSAPNPINMPMELYLDQTVKISWKAKRKIADAFSWLNMQMMNKVDMTCYVARKEFMVYTVYDNDDEYENDPIIEIALLLYREINHTYTWAIIEKYEYEQNKYFIKALIEEQHLIRNMIHCCDHQVNNNIMSILNNVKATAKRTRNRNRNNTLINGNNSTNHNTTVYSTKL